MGEVFYKEFLRRDKFRTYSKFKPLPYHIIQYSIMPLWFLVRQIVEVIAIAAHFKWERPVQELLSFKI